MSEQPKYKDIFKLHESGVELAQRAAVIWAEVYEELDVQGLTSKSRLAILDRYVRARVEYEFLYPEAIVDGPVKKAASGGEYANMKWAAISKLNDRIMKLEASLLLSPHASDGKKVKPRKRGSNKFLNRE